MSAYTWGLGKSGQLGTGTDSTCHTPQLLKSREMIGSDHVSQIASGGLYTCCLTSDGRGVSFGCGKHGRLGNGDDSDTAIPQLVQFPPQTKVVQISCGSWHGSAITEDGTLFAWGYPRACGLGNSSADPRGVLVPTQVPNFTHEKLSGVSCGHNYTLAWTEGGQAFSWGCGRHGVLGQGSENEVATPRKIAPLEGVTYMNAGYAHAGVVTRDGKVYMFGKGTDGALGLGEDNLKNMLLPTPIDGVPGTRFKELSCSVGEHHGHTLALATNGSVYSWGDGYKGKLGLGDQHARFVPSKISQTAFLDESIVHVAAGGIHSASVSGSGHIFTWGCGSDGRLGHPEGKGHRYLFRSDSPKIVDFFKSSQTVTNVVCSYYHTVALVTEKKKC